jgi:hypothetical protein
MVGASRQKPGERETAGMDHEGDKAALPHDAQANSEVNPTLEPFQPPSDPAEALPPTRAGSAYPAATSDPTTDLLPRLRRLVEAATARVRAVEQENAQLDEHIADLARQNVNLLAERQALLSQIAGLQGQLKNLEEQREELTAQTTYLEQQVATLHDDHERLATAVAGHQEQLQQLQQTRGQEQSALLTLAEELERLAQIPATASEHSHDTADSGDNVPPASTAAEEATAAPAIPAEPAEPAPAAPVQSAPLTSSEPAQPASEPADAENEGARTAPPDTTPPAPAEESPAASSEAFSSSYTVIAYPFARFSDLGQFQAAVQGLPDVQSVRVRRFAQGTLEMRVEYEGKTPLTSALRDLPLDVEEIQQEEPYQLRVRLRAASLL